MSRSNTLEIRSLTLGIETKGAKCIFCLLCDCDTLSLMGLKVLFKLVFNHFLGNILILVENINYLSLLLIMYWQ